MYKVIGCVDIQDADQQRPYYGTGIIVMERLSRNGNRNGADIADSTRKSRLTSQTRTIVGTLLIRVLG